MKKSILFASLMLLPMYANAGVCTLFGGDGCANGNYYGYNTHKAHVEGMKYHQTGVNGYGISKGYPWYGDFKGYYPEYITDAEYMNNQPTVVQPVFRNKNNNFYAPPTLDYMIEIRPIKGEPTSMMSIDTSHAEMDYMPRQMVRAGNMGAFQCINNLCAPVYTPAQLQDIAARKRVFNNPIEDGAVFESIYKIINERYIKPITVEELAVAGISNLYEGIGIRINDDDNTVSLTRNGISIRTFKDKPYKEDVVGWSELTYKIVETLAHQSLKFGIQRHADVFKRFFDGIATRLDDASKYVDTKDNIPAKINNRKIDALLYSIKHKDNFETYDDTKDVYARLNNRKQVVLVIKKFDEHTPRMVKVALSPFMQAMFDKKSAGLIIDLRNNKGGLVGSAIDTADIFLEKGKTIAMTKGRHKDSERLYESVSDDMLKGVKIALVVNEKTASAAEILTAALKDNERAIVVGKKTYGKGTVQTAIAMDDGAEISFSWAYLYTPDGKIVDAVGIEPDEFVKGDDFSLMNYASRDFDRLEAKKHEKTEAVSEIKTETTEKVEAKEGDSSNPDAVKEDKKVEATADTVKEEVKVEKVVETPVLENKAEPMERPKITPIEEKKVEEKKVEVVEEKQPEIVDKTASDFTSMIKSKMGVSDTKETVEPKVEKTAEPKAEEKESSIIEKVKDATSSAKKKALDWFSSDESSKEKGAESKVESKIDGPASPLDMIKKDENGEIKSTEVKTEVKETVTPKIEEVKTEVKETVTPKIEEVKAEIKETVTPKIEEVKAEAKETVTEAKEKKEPETLDELPMLF